jgi:prepilin-type N-terminal cleavage/methylation domain-containing protein
VQQRTNISKPLRLARRRGFTLAEVLVAAVVLGAALAVTVQLSGGLRTKQREAHRRACALAEANNCLQRLTATPWNELTPERAAECRLSAHAAAQLPGGELKIDIATEDETKRILVAVRWRDAADRPVAPLRLAAWVHRADATAAEE